MPVLCVGYAVFLRKFVLRICEGRPGAARDMSGGYAEAVLGLCDGMAGDNSRVAQNGFHRFRTGCGGARGIALRGISVDARVVRRLCAGGARSA